jgi:hypothetical protein
METKKSAKKAPEKKARKGPAQGSLPGMEDRAIAELEALAEDYADVRDKRMSLTTKETELNDELLVMMKKYKKSEYHHGDVHCWLKSTDEKVKVKIGELPVKKTTQKATDFPPPEPEVEDSALDAKADAEEAEFESETVSEPVPMVKH